MTLIDYLKRMQPGRRATFAAAVGTTVAHLNNVAYGKRVASAALTRQIALKSEGNVREWDLRPDDWQLIWPELAAEHTAATCTA